MLPRRAIWAWDTCAYWQHPSTYIKRAVSAVTHRNFIKSLILFAYQTHHCQGLACTDILSLLPHSRSLVEHAFLPDHGRAGGVGLTFSCSSSEPCRPQCLRGQASRPWPQNAEWTFADVENVQEVRTCRSRRTLGGRQCCSCMPNWRSCCRSTAIRPVVPQPSDDWKQRVDVGLRYWQR